MSINFKTLLLVFLVGLLGSGIGTFGVLSLYNQNKPPKPDSQLVLNEVSYTNTVSSGYSEAISKVYDSVVEINAEVLQSGYFFFGGTTKGKSAGSGVIISQDGYIVTNHHVISGAIDENSITIKLSNGTAYTAKIIGTDEKSDLALLKIEAEGLPFASFADSDKLVLGQEAIAIGNPLGLGISCSNGIVSALEKEIYINDVYLSVIQTNAAVNAGNSGGGLFDIEGNLIGIVNAKTNSSMASTVEGMGYAIPAKRVITIITDLKENGYVKDRPALGIYAARNANVEGVLVTQLLEQGSAKKAGIQVNDIIVAIDDTKVKSFADLSKVLDSKQIGEKITVTVQRNGEKVEIPLTLQETINE